MISKVESFGNTDEQISRWLTTDAYQLLSGRRRKCVFCYVVVIGKHHWTLRGHVFPSNTSVSSPVKLLEIFQRKINIFLPLRPCARKRSLQENNSGKK